MGCLGGRVRHRVGVRAVPPKGPYRVLRVRSADVVVSDDSGRLDDVLARDAFDGDLDTVPVCQRDRIRVRVFEREGEIPGVIGRVELVECSPRSWYLHRYMCH